MGGEGGRVFSSLRDAWSNRWCLIVFGYIRIWDLPRLLSETAICCQFDRLFNQLLREMFCMGLHGIPEMNQHLTCLNMPVMTPVSPGDHQVHPITKTRYTADDAHNEKIVIMIQGSGSASVL